MKKAGKAARSFKAKMKMQASALYRATPALCKHSIKPATAAE
jgi:hypothetical protein